MHACMYICMSEVTVFELAQLLQVHYSHDLYVYVYMHVYICMSEVMVVGLARLLQVH
jgi:hypothetical protein